MGSRGARVEPTSVTIRAGDDYLARLGRECLRLEHHLKATSDLLDERRALIAVGLTSRNLTRLDHDGIHIRVDRSGVVIA